MSPSFYWIFQLNTSDVRIYIHEKLSKLIHIYKYYSQHAVLITSDQNISYYLQDGTEPVSEYIITTYKGVHNYKLINISPKG